MTEKNKKTKTQSVAETLCGTELRGIGRSIEELENEILSLGENITIAAENPPLKTPAKKPAKPSK